MSAEHPQTLEERRNFRFPVRERSTLSEAAQQVAAANGEAPADNQDEGEDDGKGRQGRGGAAQFHPPEGPAPLPDLAVHGTEPLAPPVETPRPHPEPPVVSPPPEAPESTVPSAAPASTAPAPDEVEPSPMGAGAGDSWTYDAARAILINWRIEKAMVLAKMDTVARIRAFIGEVEKNHIDRWGFETALDEACKDVHKVSLADILDTWPNDTKMRWSAPPEKACLPTSRPRRRSPSR